MVTGSAVMTAPTVAEGGLPCPTPCTAISRSVTMPTRRSPSTTRSEPTLWRPSNWPASSRVHPGGTVTGAVRRHSLTNMAVHPVRCVRAVVSPGHSRGNGPVCSGGLRFLGQAQCALSHNVALNFGGPAPDRLRAREEEERLQVVDRIARPGPPGSGQKCVGEVVALQDLAVHAQNVHGQQHGVLMRFRPEHLVAGPQ